MISAKIIKDSIAPNGKRITTFELEYPRFIHAEFLTHKMVARNSSSSRALPVKSSLEHVKNNMAYPIHWGKQQPGMQAKEELTGWRRWWAERLWKWSGRCVALFVWAFMKLGLHKQVANRILEPWTHIKVVATATNWDNFFHLRRHPDAQPELHHLAGLMYNEFIQSYPTTLVTDEWHLPYIEQTFVSTGDSSGKIRYFILDENCNREYLSLEEAQKISASLCAQVSYRKSDQSLAKAMKIYQKLVESKPVHASPFEHQATPMEDPTAVSGNLRGWFQLRFTIPDHVCLDYQPTQ